MSAVTLRVFRYVPGADEAPRWQDYALPPGLDGSLLEALAHIKAHLDPTLAWRWSCRMGVCGSCGLMVDGEPRLGCEVFLRDLPRRPITVGPLEHFPVIRDLVVDIERFMGALSAVKPWVHEVPGRPTSPVGESLVRPHQQAALIDPSECINCLLCYAACPQVGLTPDFVGPAALALAHRYAVDPRDGGDRHDVVQGEHGVWGCTVVGSCTRVCPKAVDPAGAIQQQKVAGLFDYLRHALPWSRS